MHFNSMVFYVYVWKLSYFLHISKSFKKLYEKTVNSSKIVNIKCQLGIDAHLKKKIIVMKENIKKFTKLGKKQWKPL